MESEAWKALKLRWTREHFAQSYGSLQFPSVTIP